MSSVTKSYDQIRVNSGNNFKVKINNIWQTLGHIISGKLSPKPGKTNVKLADGVSVNKVSSREFTFEVVLGQVSSAILKKIASIDGTAIECYYYNGKEGDVDQEFYFPSGEVSWESDLDLKAETHQMIALNISLNAVPGLTIVPTEDLPSDAKCTYDQAISDSYKDFFFVIDSNNGTLVP